MITEDTGLSKGHAYIEFEEVEDADEAVFNMDDAEFFDRVLRVEKSKRPPKTADKPIWEQEFYQQQYMNVESAVSDQPARL